MEKFLAQLWNEGHSSNYNNRTWIQRELYHLLYYFLRLLLTGRMFFLWPIIYFLYELIQHYNSTRKMYIKHINPIQRIEGKKSIRYGALREINPFRECE